MITLVQTENLQIDIGLTDNTFKHIADSTWNTLTNLHSTRDSSDVTNYKIEIQSLKFNFLLGLEGQIRPLVLHPDRTKKHIKYHY